MDQKIFLRFHRILQALIIYTLLVILWGAWVRISHSGDGCGQSWPLCHGDFIPDKVPTKTWIEYAHRLMSGFYGILIIGLFFYQRKLLPLSHRARRIGGWALFFMITEALLGAKLVLFKLVGSNDSFFRVFVMSLHQLNSLLLMGSTVIWALWFPKSSTANQLTINPTAATPIPLRTQIFSFLLIAITGAWAALSTTLFPSQSLQESLQKDFAPESHWLLKLRLAHPVLALIIGILLVTYFWKKSQNLPLPASKWAMANAVLFTIALLIGMLTLLLLSPLVLKLTHLAMAHILWIALLGYAVTSADSTRR